MSRYLCEKNDVSYRIRCGESGSEECVRDVKLKFVMFWFTKTLTSSRSRPNLY